MKRTSTSPAEYFYQLIISNRVVCLSSKKTIFNF